jgi:hypothetical protein
VRLRGLIDLAIPIPLHSNRGSLHRSRQGHVPVNAVPHTLTRAVHDVKRHEEMGRVPKCLGNVSLRAGGALKCDSGLPQKHSHGVQRGGGNGGS